MTKRKRLMTAVAIFLMLGVPSTLCAAIPLLALEGIETAVLPLIAVCLSVVGAFILFTEAITYE